MWSPSNGRRWSGWSINLLPLPSFRSRCWRPMLWLLCTSRPRTHTDGWLCSCGLTQRHWQSPGLGQQKNSSCHVRLGRSRWWNPARPMVSSSVHIFIRWLHLAIPLSFAVFCEHASRFLFFITKNQIDFRGMMSKTRSTWHDSFLIRPESAWLQNSPPPFVVTANWRMIPHRRAQLCQLESRDDGCGRI